MGIGLFRLLLSFAVVITHTYPVLGFAFGNPVIAVRSFFVISGFYMALILSQRYAHYRDFVSSRFLRLYPLYWAVLLLTILAGIGAHFVSGHWGELQDFVAAWPQLDWSSRLAVIGSNLTIIGRNTLMFLGIDPQSGLLTYAQSYELPVWPFLLIPQAWTLGIEIAFYLLAPFLVKLRSGWLALLLAGSIALRYYLVAQGYDSVLWTYRFFPTELVYFLFGIFAYRIYVRLPHTPLVKYLGLTAFYLAVAMLWGFNYVPRYWDIQLVQLEWLYYPLLAALIPFIFVYSKNLRFDRIIGEYSYPVYIIHILILNTVGALFLTKYVSNDWLALGVFAVSMAASWVLLRWVQEPADRKRLVYKKPASEEAVL